jgi:hypothetical protein
VASPNQTDLQTGPDIEAGDRGVSVDPYLGPVIVSTLPEGGVPVDRRNTVKFDESSFLRTETGQTP